MLRRAFAGERELLAHNPAHRAAHEGEVHHGKLARPSSILARPITIASPSPVETSASASRSVYGRWSKKPSGSSERRSAASSAKLPASVSCSIAPASRAPRSGDRNVGKRGGWHPIRRPGSASRTWGRYWGGACPRPTSEEEDAGARSTRRSSRRRDESSGLDGRCHEIADCGARAGASGRRARPRSTQCSPARTREIVASTI